MSSAGSVRRFFGLTGLAVIAMAGVAAIERSFWPAIPVLGVAILFALPRFRPIPARPRNAAALSLVTFAGALFFTDIAATRVGQRVAIGHLAYASWLQYARPIMRRAIAGKCPRYRWRPGDGRDADGFTEYTLGGGGNFDVFIVGDPVVNTALASDLAPALTAAGIKGQIIDSSMGSYDAEDEGCIVDQELAKQRPSLVIVGICLNDFSDGNFDLDLGSGSHTYHWGGEFDERQQTLGRIPLFIESGTRWAEGHRKELLDRYGSAIHFDYADPVVFNRTLKDQGTIDALARLTRTAQELKAAGVPTIFLQFPLNYSHPEVADGLHAAIDKALGGAVDVNLRAVYAGLGTDELRIPIDEATSGREFGPARENDVIHYTSTSMKLAAFVALDTAEKDLGLKNLTAAKNEIRHSLAGDGPAGQHFLAQLNRLYPP